MSFPYWISSSGSPYLSERKPQMGQICVGSLSTCLDSTSLIPFSTALPPGQSAPAIPASLPFLKAFWGHSHLSALHLLFFFVRNPLPPDTCLACSLLSFRSVLKCHLFSEDFTEHLFKIPTPLFHTPCPPSLIYFSFLAYYLLIDFVYYLPLNCMVHEGRVFLSGLFTTTVTPSGPRTPGLCEVANNICWMKERVSPYMWFFWTFEQCVTCFTDRFLNMLFLPIPHYLSPQKLGFHFLFFSFSAYWVTTEFLTLC